MEALYTYILNLTISIGLHINPAKHPAVPDSIKLSIKDGCNGLCKNAFVNHISTLQFLIKHEIKCTEWSIRCYSCSICSI